MAAVWLTMCLLQHLILCACSLRWYNISNATEVGALCNDFSVAGYFIRENASSSDWIIFLEGGGGCNSPSSCNERFIDSTVRQRYTYVVNGTEVVDVEQAWNNSLPDPLAVTSKLMTSLWRFRGAGVVEWEINGTDIFSTNASINPQFSTYNHVLIPYCSSDLWLLNTNDFVKAQTSNFHFQYDPTSQVSQFTFRGVSILRSVVRDLFAFHGFRKATVVMLAGSSAGGVGVLNHAQWLKEQLDAHCTQASQLLVMGDSSWFINFHDNLERRASFDNVTYLAESDQILPACVANSFDSTPCVSAPSILTTPGLFPTGVPILAILSLYDLYFLQDSLLEIKPVAYLDLLRVVAEYGGSMNESLQEAGEAFPSLSYYVTSCFQHTYLASSTLWGGEGSLFGDAAIGGEVDDNKFIHTIRSGVWDTFSMLALNENYTLERLTISDAIYNWLQAARLGGVVRYRDSCDGPHCNPNCPEKIILGVLTSYWNFDYQAVVLAAVVGVSGASVLVKLVLQLFSWYSEYRQTRYLRWLGHGCKDEIPVLPLPQCQEVDAISVACLNLRYTVKIRDSVLQDVVLAPTVKSPDEAKRKMSIAAAAGSVTMEGVGARSEMLRHAARNRSVNSDICSDWQQSRYQVPSTHRTKKRASQEIIRGISTYFNPGELVAIMGPSGCGKTTFLDLLAGRKKSGEIQGEIFVNSIPMGKVRDWYIANTGYVLQLATPYYEELTVRENLTLAAQMRLSSSLTLTERLERVEQVMVETGLTAIADTRIGCSLGGGLSGGQKRRLCVALQILSMPSLLFLDEPTSGLDASSSLELLTYLNRLAESNRTVVLTIHQPRLEIFHMFDKIMLLCQGQVAYHGVPEKAYEVFINAYKFSDLAHSPLSNLDTTNPADMIMDMLSSERARAAILCYYQHTQEPQAVENAIEISTSASTGTADSRVLGQMKRQGRVSIFSQLSALERRAQKRATFSQLLYLPLIFVAYSILLGTVYLQTNSPTSLVTGFGIFSCASGLFMFPIIYGYLSRTLEIFSLEHADGVGSPAILVLQTFIRFAALSVFPITSSCLGLYLLAVPYSQYSLRTITQMAIFTLSLNHVWIALLVLVICTLPSLAHRISPVLSAITGFVGGFFVPRELMPIWYRWLFYVNPNYYGFSSMIRLLLGTTNLGCLYDSDVECYPTSSMYVLTYFNFNDINPHLHLVVLLAMTWSLLLLSWLTLTLRHSNVTSLSPRCKVNNKGQQSPEEIQRKEEHKDGEEGHHVTSEAAGLPKTCDVPAATCTSLTLDLSNDHSHQAADKSASPLETSATHRPSRQSSLTRSTHSTLLQEGESHEVWRPGCQRSRYSRSRGTIADRQKSLLKRISSYRSTSGGLDILPEAGMGSWKTKERLGEEDREKRLSQWRRIEEDALVASGCPSAGLSWCTQTVPGDKGEGRRPHHHVLPCRDSPLVPSTPNLSSMYASMPDMSGGVVLPPPHSALDFPELPTESQTLPRRLRLGRMKREGEEGVPSCSEAAPKDSADVSNMASDTEQSDMEGESHRAAQGHQRHATSPVPTASRCHPYPKRESFAEMVPIPEEEGELASSQHGHRLSLRAHGAASTPDGIMPPTREPLGNSVQTPSMQTPSAGDPLSESVLGARLPQGGWPLPQSMYQAHHPALLVRRDDSQLHAQSRAGQPSPDHCLPSRGFPQRDLNSIVITGLHSSPGRRPQLPPVSVRSGVPLGQTTHEVAASRQGTHLRSSCRQTDV